MASNSSAPDQDNQIVANANVSSSGKFRIECIYYPNFRFICIISSRVLTISSLMHTVERSVDHQNVPRPGNLLESNAPVNMYFDNNDPDDDYDGIDLTTENGDEVFVKREPKVENEIEIDEVDLPVVQFDPNEYNARYASVASGTRRSKLMNKKILQSSSSIAQKQRNRYDIRIAKLKVNADDSRRKPHGNQHQRLQGHHKSIVGCENNRSLWDCGRCMCLFSQESEMNEHEKCCQKRRYECERCNKFVTVNRSSMRKHTRLHCS